MATTTVQPSTIAPPAPDTFKSVPPLTLSDAAVAKVREIMATQDPVRQRALVVEDKAPRVANYHRNTLRALAELLGSAGLQHPREIKPWHLQIRHQSGAIVRGDYVYPQVRRGALLDGEVEGDLGREWARARADSFEPAFMRAEALRLCVARPLWATAARKSCPGSSYTHPTPHQP